MIKSNGGVFGRNPTFNTVTVSGAINAGAASSVSGNLTLGSGNLVVSSGNGIDFSATSNSTGTMTSELLADYEEGTWTPTISLGLTSPTYGGQNGWYVKVGAMVYFQAFVFTTGGTWNSSQVRVGGLPFTSANNSTTGLAGAYFTFTNSFGGGLSALPRLIIENNATEIRMNDTDGGSYVGTDGIILGIIRVTGMYRAS